MKLLIHPEKPLGIIIHPTQQILILCDLSEAIPKVITTRSYPYYLTLAANHQNIWVFYQKKTKFEEPFYIDILDWNLALIKEFKISESCTWIQSCAISNNNRFIGFASIGETINLYDAYSTKLLSRLYGGEGISGVNFSPNSQYLSALHTSQGGGRIEIYQIKNNKLKQLFWFDEENLTSATRLTDFADTFGYTVFTPDNRYVIALGINNNMYSYGSDWFGELFCLDVLTGECRWTTAIDKDLIPDMEEYLDTSGYTQISFDSTGKKFAIGSPEGKVLEFNTADGSLLKLHQLDSEYLMIAVAYEHQGNRIWALDEEYRIYCIELEPKQLSFEYSFHPY